MRVGIAGGLCATLALLSACTDGSEPDRSDRSTSAPTASAGADLSEPPPPSSPSPSGLARMPGTDGGGRPELGHRGSELAWVVYADPDVAVAGWRVCGTDPSSAGPCADLLTRTDDGWATSTSRYRHGGSALLTSDGRVATWPRPRLIAVSDNRGNVQRFTALGPAEPASPSAALVGSPGGFDLWAFDESTRAAHPVPMSPHISARYAAVRDATGRLWVQGWGADTSLWVAWTDDGGATWTEHRTLRQGYPGGLAVGHAGHVVAWGWNAPDHHHVVGRSVITRDAGTTWQPFARRHGPDWVDTEAPIGGPGSVTITPNGTLYVVEAVGHVGAAHRLWTATGDWSNLHQLPKQDAVDWIQSNGDLLWGGHSNRDILISHDAGQSWNLVSPR
jgi:hypothetical protein